MSKTRQELFVVKALYSFVEQKKNDKKETDKVLKAVESDAEADLYGAIDDASDNDPGPGLEAIKSMRQTLSDAASNRAAVSASFKADIDGGIRAMTAILIPSIDGRQMTIDMSVIDGDGVEIFPDDVEVVRSAVEIYETDDADIAEAVMERLSLIENASLQAANDG